MIGWLVEMVREAVADNQFFQGGFVLAALASLVAGVRYIPTAIRALLNRYYSVAVEVRDRALVAWMGQWLAGHEYSGRCRRLLITLSRRYDPETNQEELVVKPGFGSHFFRHDGRWFWLDHVLEDAGGGDSQSFFIRPEVVTLRTWGRDTRPVRAVVEAAYQIMVATYTNKNVAHVNDHFGGWDVLSTGQPRQVDSVVLAAGIAEEIIEDIRRFFDRAEWYKERGIPHRRGYLFKGPPGNGKSSFIQALIGEFGMPLYVLSMTDKEFTDRSLARAIAALPTRAVLLLEDVDSSLPARMAKKRKGGVTMSGVLNAIDGAIASEGRILILTTNHPEKLDPALVRPGRIDRQYVFDDPDVNQAARLFLRFFHDGDVDRFEGIFIDCFGAGPGAVSMCQLQEALIQSDENVDQFFELLAAIRPYAEREEVPGFAGVEASGVPVAVEASGRRS